MRVFDQMSADRLAELPAGEHSRLDTKNRVPASMASQRRIIQSLDELLPRLDAVIVADQAEERDCGVITAAVRDFLAEAALLGNFVASITVQQLATTGVARPDQLAPRLALRQSQCS
jgi:hypothetical protein